LNSLRISQHGKELLAEWEGAKTEVYVDSAGLPTIGIGHLLDSGFVINIAGEQVDTREGISQAQMYQLLEQDLIPAENRVRQDVIVLLNQNQFDSLVCFTFNVGTNAFRTSTLLKVLNAGNYQAVPDAMRLWNKVTDPNTGAKIVSSGLVNRREKEIKLWHGVI